MKKKIIEILKEKGEMNITDLHTLMPEINGDYAIRVGVKEGVNPNMVWINGVTLEFAEAFQSLMYEEKKIDWRPVEKWEYLVCGSPYYPDLPIATPKRAKGNKPCWMLIAIKLIKP